MTNLKPEEKLSRTGKSMIFIGFILAFILLTLLFQNKLDLKYNPNQQPHVISVNGQQEVVLKRNRMGHYVVNGFINGKKVTFLVDTGATTVALPETVAKRLGLKYGQAYTSHTAAGPAKTYSTQLLEVSVGGITVVNIEGAIVPRMQGEAILLGMSFLKYLDITQRQGLLSLKVPQLESH